MRLTPGSEGHQPRMRTTPLEIPQPGIRCQRRDSQSSHSLRYRWSQSEWPPNRQNPTGASGTHVKPPMRQNNLICAARMIAWAAHLDVQIGRITDRRAADRSYME
jgi:hypothetical protein